MTRRTTSILLLVLALLIAVAIWVFGGFLWPRPQFQQPDAPWSQDARH